MKQLISRYRLGRKLITAILTSSSFLTFTPSYAATNDYCQLSDSESAQKANLLQTVLKGNAQSQKDYNTLIKKHAELLQRCR